MVWMCGYSCCVSILSVDFVCDVFFFFKQKTAYEMRISDWSSDVCSSDLLAVCGVDRKIFQPEPGKIADRTKILAFIAEGRGESFCLSAAARCQAVPAAQREHHAIAGAHGALEIETAGNGLGHESRFRGDHLHFLGNLQIGRASCRERVCQYVSISGVAESL